MSDRDDNLTSPRTQPLYMWEIGYEHAIDSMRLDTPDTDEDRDHAARFAGLMFASAQARSLAQIEKHLGELVEQQKLANVIGAIGLSANAYIFPELDEQKHILRFIGDQVRTIIGGAE